MNHKDYQKAIEVSENAARLPPEEKSIFLEDACDGDAEFRRMVENLISSGDSGDLQTAPLENELPNALSTQLMDETQKLDFPGTDDHQFGNYKILGKIGKGGMGEVYLAQDTILDRKVALKLLPAKLVNEPQYLQRFKQEARAASALNHPYILTIFEFGQSADGVQFIASEYVEGQTLNKFCAEKAPDLPEKLDVLIKIASALSAAHEAGIIHRDIKPENIIVRPDGYVKVLDFGLAKLIGTLKALDDSSEAETFPLINTNPGMIMGTASYMSPEQAKGKEVDARTDIFSFGVVLYETIAGYLPFNGTSMMEMVAAILHTEPKQLNDPQVPREVKRIIEKSLKKDRAARYQTMKDLLLDLNEVRRELDFQRKMKQNDTFAESTAENAMNRTKQPAAAAAGETAIIVGAKDTVRIGAAGRFDYSKILLILLAAAFSVGAVWWLTTGKLNKRISSDPGLTTAYKTQEVTNWANSAGELSSTAAFSGDGRFIAFGSTQSGTTSIWVKQTSSGDAIQVTKDEFYNRFPVWSPNGEEIAYYSKRGDSYGLWRVSLMGGEKQLIAGNIDLESKPRRWSKSGKIYFQGTYNLFAADVETGEVTQVTNFPAASMPVRVIKVSPDESEIAFLSVENDVWKIKVAPLNGGEAAEIFQSKNLIENLVWHPDGQSILFSGKTEEFYQIFSVDRASGAAIQLSNGNSDGFVQDVSADGTRILFNSVTESLDLWRIETAGGKESLTASQIDAELWSDVSRDNQMIVYQSVKNLRQGSHLFKGSIVIQSLAKDSRPQQIREKGFLPQWSPNGEAIAFLKVNAGKLEVWKAAKTGDQLKLVSADGIDGFNFNLSPYLTYCVKYLSWSPDGSALAFPSRRQDLSNIWLAAADGSGERMISANQNPALTLGAPIWSSDGKRIAFSSQSKKVSAEKDIKPSLWLYDTIAGSQQKILETDGAVRLLGWTPNEEELVFAVQKYTEVTTLTPPETVIRTVSVKSGRQRDRMILRSAYFNNIYLSFDRQSIAFTARSNNSDEIWTASIESGSPPRRLIESNDARLYYSSLTWSPDGKSIFFGKQIRFTLLSMLINQKALEEKNAQSNK